MDSNLNSNTLPEIKWNSDGQMKMKLKQTLIYLPLPIKSKIVNNKELMDVKFYVRPTLKKQEWLS